MQAKLKELYLELQKAVDEANDIADANGTGSISRKCWEATARAYNRAKGMVGQLIDWKAKPESGEPNNLQKAFAMIARYKMRETDAATGKSNPKKPTIHWNGNEWGCPATGPISYEVARAAWDDVGSVKWSAAAHAEMGRIVMGRDA